MVTTQVPYYLREIENLDTATGPGKLILRKDALQQRVAQEFYLEDINELLAAAKFAQEAIEEGYDPRTDLHYGEDYMEFSVYYYRPHTKEEEQEKREDLWKKVLKFKKDTLNQDLELYRKLQKKFGSQSTDDLM